MSKIERKGSFESAGLKKTRQKNAKEERVDLLFAGQLNDAITSVRTWMEECIGVKSSSLSFDELVDDGTVLCELVQSIQPGVVKKISRVKSRFAYWENFTFFLKACKTLGLQDWQLFDPEELLGQKTVSGNTSRPSRERRVKNIVAILYWLALTLEASPHFSVPKINRQPFVDSFQKSIDSPPYSDHSPYSPSPHTPEHRLISVSTPNIEQNQSSPRSSPASSPLPWVEKVRDGNSVDPDRYRFTQSDAHLDESSCYRASSQHSVLSTDSNSQQDYQSKKRKETLSVRVEAYNPPSAFNADLVFVHDSTSSSVFSPTGDNQTVNSTTPFSPNHLSNTFGATDPIDSTGLIIDPLEFHSEVFTAGTDSQESGPHFSSPRPEGTFHVNLTQTSQPDNLSISNTQLDDFTGVTSELPVISEVAPNSSPIDTFDLHRNGQIPGSSLQTPPSHSNIEYSHSQEYNERQIQHIDTHTPNSYVTDTPTPYSSSGSKPRGTSFNSSRSRDSSTSKQDSPNTSTTSSASLIVVGYSPRNSSDSVSPLTKRSLYHSVTENSSDRKPPYRRYSSPQQRPGYKSTKTVVVPSENSLLHSESSSEGESEMALTKTNRASGKRQMHVLPAEVLLGRRDNENGVQLLSNGALTTDLHATFLPGEKHHGIILETSLSHTHYPVVSSVREDTPASRCGVQPGDELTGLNGVSLYNLSIEDSIELLKKAIVQKTLSLSLNRDMPSDDSGESFPRSSLDQEPSHKQNGIHEIESHGVNNARPRKIFPRFQSLDLKRVHSGALPLHQVASTVYATTDPNLPTNTDIPLKINSHEGLEIDQDLSSTSRNGNDLTNSRHGSSFNCDDKESHDVASPSSKGTHIDEYHVAEDEEHTYPLNRSNSPHQFSLKGSSASPVDDYLKDDNSFVCSGTGKSQSVTELSTISPLPSVHHSRDKSDTGLSNYSKAHNRAKKTESLPGKFRVQSLNFKDRSNNRSSVSTPGLGMGLGLTNMSIEDVHSASKLQIDQIWKEVESSSSLVSPVDDIPDGKGYNQMDTIYTQTPDDWPSDSQVPTETEELQLRKSLSLSSSGTGPSNTSSSTQRTEHRSDQVGGVPVRRSSSKINEKKGIESLLTTLRSLNEKVGTYEEEEEFKLLESILQSSKFKKAKELHDDMKSLVTGGSEAAQPTIRRIAPVSQYIRHYLREDILRPTKETEELRRLLKKPDVQSTLFCHDKVATHDLYVPSRFFPRSAQDQEDIILTHSVLDLPTSSLYTNKEAPLSRDVPCNRKENATIVYLQRTNRPLGCAIYKDGDSVFVSKILEGCDAEQSGAIKEGDELLEVNGIALVGKSNDEIIRLMSGEAGKTVSFTLIPVHDDSADLYYEEKYVRAHFNYDGMLDEEIPCKELALSFSRADILEVSNQDDPDWWQARKVFEDGGESLPGLIPARHLQQKREVLKESHAVHNAIEEKNKRRGFFSKISRKNKKKKIYFNQGPLSGAFHSVGHEVATYEDVVKLMPDTNRKRPIILIGAPSVGRSTLVKRMIDSYPKQYSSAIPHVTRPPRPGERDGRDCHFVSREDMERAIQDGRFLDYTEVKGHLQGTAISSVKDVIDTGKIPVLTLLPQALKVIGSSGLIPYVIFIAAPRVERLQMTRKVTYEKKKKMQTSLSVDYLDRDTRSFTENELIELYQKSQELQLEYGHYFNWIVVNDDLQIAADLLLEVVRRIEEEPQWVSASWVEEV